MAKTMPPDMSNVLADDKKQQILALGRLGWSLRRIEDATGVRRETASCVPQSRGGPRSSTARAAEGVAAKTGQSGGGVHRPRAPA